MEATIVRPLSAKSLVLLESQVLTAKGFAHRYRVPSTTSTGQPRRTDNADRFANVVMEGGPRRLHEESPALVVRPEALWRYRPGRLWVSVDTLAFSFWLPFKWHNVAFPYGGAAAIPFGMSQNFRALADPGINNGCGWDSPFPHDKGHYALNADALSVAEARKKHPMPPRRC